MQVIPFNYRFDGGFTRSSKGWYTRDDGLIVEANVDIRRVVLRGALSDPWIWMEGTRQNHLLAPLRADDLAWTDAANATTVIEVPTGDDEVVGQLQPAEVINQRFLVGAQPVIASWSIFARTTNGATDQVRPSIVNGAPATTVDVDINPTLWTRAVRKGISLNAAGDKLAQLQSDPQCAVWGACVETGPAFVGDARFPSQPILETGTRTAEKLLIGTVTSEFLDVQSGPKGLTIRYAPDFASADVVAGESFFVFLFDSGNPATSLGLFLDGTGPGAVRVRAGVPTGTLVSSGALTFAANQRLNFNWDLRTGTLTVSGATTGNGTFVNGSYAVPVSTLLIGSSQAGQEAWGLISPLEFNFDDVFLASVDQLTLNSVKVTFETGVSPVDVLQFNPRGLTDALNPRNYIVTGSPGLPSVQHVEPGEVGSEVVLFFDGILPPDSLVTIRVVNVVLAGVVAVPVFDGERAAVDAFAQTGPTGLSSVWEVVQPGVLGELAILETEFDAAPPKPGVNGVEIINADPNRPHIRYHFALGETTGDMESAITEVAGHLIRLRIPSALRLLVPADEYVLTFDTELGDDPIALSLIAFGAEVNATAQVETTFPRVDLANPQTERDAGQGASLGTYAVTDAGDLANDHGRAYLRKRIFRRLATFKSAFFHLVDYGLKPPSKKLFTPTTLRRLQLDIEIQVRQEPGVVAARATVTELRPGIVAVKLRVQDDNGSFDLDGALDFTAE